MYKKLAAIKPFTNRLTSKPNYIQKLTQTPIIYRTMSSNSKNDTPVPNIRTKWNPDLTDSQLMILKDKYTERPHTGAYLNNKDTGIYHCANCNAPLYKSDTKFDSHCGWPSFYEEIPGALEYYTDSTLGMKRVEICCKQCDGHLGHVFEGEGWDKKYGLPKDARHCVNGGSLSFKKN